MLFFSSIIFFFSGVKLEEFHARSFTANIDNSGYSAFSPAEIQQQGVLVE